MSDTKFMRVKFVFLDLMKVNDMNKFTLNIMFKTFFNTYVRQGRSLVGARNTARDFAQYFSNALDKEIDNEVNAAEQEIINLKNASSEKIKNIAIETSSELIKQLIGEEANNSSISAIVEDQSRKIEEKQNGV